MIAVPQGFTVVPGGERMTLVPAGGAQLGLIRYKERVRPLARLGEIVQQQLAACPGFQLARRGTPERLLTQEGEHAAFLELWGEEYGRPALRLLGVVFGDDFYALTSALCLEPAAQQPAWSALVRTLVVGDSLGLGLQRRRRYEYQPPDGWEPFVSGAVTDWVPAGFPREAAAITVFAALPRQQAPSDLFALWLAQMEAAGAAVQSRTPPTPVKTHAGLRGQHFAAVLTGNQLPLQRHLIVFEDATYSYALALKVDGPDDREPLARFVAMARSIQAVPAGAPAVHTLVRHWWN